MSDADLGQCDICDEPAVKVIIGEAGDFYFCKAHAEGLSGETR